MARIAKYPQDTSISADDLLVGTDAEDSNVTKNYSIGDIRNFIAGTVLKETTIVLGYDELSALNGGNTTTTFTIPELTSTSALAIVDVTAYLEAGTTAFDLSFNTYLMIGLGSGSNFKQKLQLSNNDNFINSSTSVYFNQGVQPMTQGAYYNPSPLGAELSIKFEGTGGITQGDGTLTLKVLYRLIDFS